MARVKNSGTETAYVPTDTGTLALDGGETSPELRFGDGDYAVRNVPAIVWADETITAAGVSKASTDPAVRPIGDFEAANPEVLRYAVIGDSPGDPSDVTVVPAADGGVAGVALGTTEVPASLQAAGVTPVVDDTTGTDQGAASGDTPADPAVTATPTGEADQLKGQALDDALKGANLSTSGTVEEKRARLAEYQRTSGENA